MNNSQTLFSDNFHVMVSGIFFNSAFVTILKIREEERKEDVLWCSEPAH